MPARSARRDAFTLVEVIVTIAIIMILASLLLVGLETAMDSGTQASCVARLKGLINASIAYANANYQMLPSGGPRIPAGGSNYYPDWAVALLPYIESGMSDTVADMDQYLKNRTQAFSDPGRPGAAFGYGYNYHFPSSPAQPGGKILWHGERYRYANAVNPSGTILFCCTGEVAKTELSKPASSWQETRASNTDGRVFFPGDSADYEPGNGGWDADLQWRPIGRHRGEVNYIAIGGNVGHATATELLSSSYGTSGCLWDNQ